jgi:hypothetical protein
VVDSTRGLAQYQEAGAAKHETTLAKLSNKLPLTQRSIAPVKCKLCLSSSTRAAATRPITPRSPARSEVYKSRSQPCCVIGLSIYNVIRASRSACTANNKIEQSALCWQNTLSEPLTFLSLLLSTTPPTHSPSILVFIEAVVPCLTPPHHTGHRIQPRKWFPKQSTSSCEASRLAISLIALESTHSANTTAPTSSSGLCSSLRSSAT